MPITVTVTLTDPTVDELNILSQLLDANKQPAQKQAEEAPRQTTARKLAPVKDVEPESTEATPEEPEDDVLGVPTLEDAVARATDLVANGQTSTVKAALAIVGCKRVSELTADKIPNFMTALEV